MRLNRPDFRVVMKVSESERGSGRCDFCQVRESKHTINGGLWWVCDECMSKEYGYMMIGQIGDEEE